MSVLERVLVAARRVRETVLRPLARESERATGADIASSPSATVTGEAEGWRTKSGSRAMAACAAVDVDGRGRHSTRPTARYQIFHNFLPLSVLFLRILHSPGPHAFLPINGVPYPGQSIVPGCTRSTSYLRGVSFSSDNFTMVSLFDCTLLPPMSSSESDLPRTRHPFRTRTPPQMAALRRRHCPFQHSAKLTDHKTNG